MTKVEILAYLSEHKHDFYQRFGVVKIGLFGSFANDTASDNSDIDILIELDQNVNNIYMKKKEFKFELEKYFQRKVDIAREKYIKPIARESIMNSITYV